MIFWSQIWQGNHWVYLNVYFEGGFFSVSKSSLEPPSQPGRPGFAKKMVGHTAKYAKYHPHSN